MGLKRVMTIIAVMLMPLLLWHQRICAQNDSLRTSTPKESQSLSVDSIEKLAAQPDFITASLLYITPSDEVYSAAGHSSMRLECPVHGLDYCFTFEDRPTDNMILGFLVGNIKAHYMFHRTADFLAKFKSQGRGVYSVRLNLTPKEKQELWRFLDKEEGKHDDWTYDYLHSNCSSMMAYALKSCLTDDRLEFHDLTPWLGGSNRYILQEIFRNSPWVELFWNMILGIDGELTGNTDGCLAPRFLFDEIQKATLTDSVGMTRKAASGGVECLIKETRSDEPLPVTPTMVCIAALVLAVSVTVCDLWTKRGYSVASRIIDVSFMAVATALGVVYTYLIALSPQVGTTWNWLAVGFNPLLFILWLCLRAKPVPMMWVYSAATVVLAALVAATPLLPQLQTSPLAFLFAAFAVRTAGNTLTLCKQQDNHTHIS